MSRWAAISQAAIRRAWEDHSLTSAQAAKQVGLTRAALYKRAKAMGLPLRPQGRRAAIDSPDFASMWRAGVLAREIARYFGAHPDTPRKTAERLGLPMRGRFGPKLTLAEYRTRQMVEAMRLQAAAERKCWAEAEMLDFSQNRRAA